jgi:hypothetical protein
MKVVLDAGALVAVDKRDRRVGAMLQVPQAQGVPVYTSVAAVAQVWRNGRKQALLARVLAGVRIVGFLPGTERSIGELLAKAGTTDVVDAHVALLVDHGDRLLTSDPTDLERLLTARRTTALIVAV